MAQGTERKSDRNLAHGISFADLSPLNRDRDGSKEEDTEEDSGPRYPEEFLEILPTVETQNKEKVVVKTVSKRGLSGLRSITKQTLEFDLDLLPEDGHVFADSDENIYETWKRMNTARLWQITSFFVATALHAFCILFPSFIELSILREDASHLHINSQIRLQSELLRYEEHAIDNSGFLAALSPNPKGETFLDGGPREHDRTWEARHGRMVEKTLNRTKKLLELGSSQKWQFVDDEQIQEIYHPVPGREKFRELINDYVDGVRALQKADERIFALATWKDPGTRAQEDAIQFAYSIDRSKLSGHIEAQVDRILFFLYNVDLVDSRDQWSDDRRLLLISLLVLFCLAVSATMQSVTSQGYFERTEDLSEKLDRKRTERLQVWFEELRKQQHRGDGRMSARSGSVNLRTPMKLRRSKTGSTNLGSKLHRIGRSTESEFIDMRCCGCHKRRRRSDVRYHGIKGNDVTLFDLSWALYSRNAAIDREDMRLRHEAVSSYSLCVLVLFEILTVLFIIGPNLGIIIMKEGLAMLEQLGTRGEIVAKLKLADEMVEAAVKSSVWLKHENKVAVSGKTRDGLVAQELAVYLTWVRLLPPMRRMLLLSDDILSQTYPIYTLFWGLPERCDDVIKYWSNFYPFSVETDKLENVTITVGDYVTLRDKREGVFSEKYKNDKFVIDKFLECHSKDSQKNIAKGTQNLLNDLNGISILVVVVCLLLQVIMTIFLYFFIARMIRYSWTWNLHDSKRKDITLRAWLQSTLRNEAAGQSAARSSTEESRRSSSTSEEPISEAAYAEGDIGPETRRITSVGNVGLLSRPRSEEPEGPVIRQGPLE